MLHTDKCTLGTRTKFWRWFADVFGELKRTGVVVCTAVIGAAIALAFLEDYQHMQADRRA